MFFFCFLQLCVRLYNRITALLLLPLLLLDGRCRSLTPVKRNHFNSLTGSPFSKHSLQALSQREMCNKSSLFKLETHVEESKTKGKQNCSVRKHSETILAQVSRQVRSWSDAPKCWNKVKINEISLFAPITVLKHRRIIHSPGRVRTGEGGFA